MSGIDAEIIDYLKLEKQVRLDGLEMMDKSAEIPQRMIKEVSIFDRWIEHLANDVTTGAEQCNLPVVSVSDLKGFIEWKDKQNKDYLGGRFMYDIKGYYKRLNEEELLDYWLERVHSR